MDRQSVRSSNISSIGYDENNRVLEIEFRHGGIYQYLNVPLDVYEELINSNSHGTYFSAKIRNNTRYRTIKLR